MGRRSIAIFPWIRCVAGPRLRAICYRPQAASYNAMYQRETSTFFTQPPPCSVSTAT